MALITSLGLFLVSVLLAVLSRIFAAEVEAWIPSVIRGLINLACSRLPFQYRERFEEEWRSHLDDTPGMLIKLSTAAGFVLAAWKIELSERRSNKVRVFALDIEGLTSDEVLEVLNKAFKKHRAKNTRLHPIGAIGNHIYIVRQPIVEDHPRAKTPLGDERTAACLKLN